MTDKAPILEQKLSFASLQNVLGIDAHFAVWFARLVLLRPNINSGAQTELIASHLKKSSHLRFLFGFCLFKAENNLVLILELWVHVSDFLLSPDLVLVVILLEINHVTVAHLGELFDELLWEICVKTVENNRETLIVSFNVA